MKGDQLAEVQKPREEYFDTTTDILLEVLQETKLMESLQKEEMADTRRDIQLFTRDTRATQS